MCIALHAPQARGFTHPLFQSLALAENPVALVLRRHKPVGALAVILTVYALVDLESITLLPLVLALLTVATVSDHQSRGHLGGGDGGSGRCPAPPPRRSANFVYRSRCHLPAVGLTVTLGLRLRPRQQLATPGRRLHG